MKFFLRTFGCKSNQYEGQAIREALLAAGHAEVPRPAEADVMVLNSCAVTRRAAASCRAALRVALRANPELQAVVTGCAVDLAEPWPGLPSSAIRVPNAKKHAIARLLANQDKNSAAAADALADIPADRFLLSVSRFEGRTRGYLKIQDGCANRCAYCAVPMARGTPESRPVGDILAEAGRLVASGHAEIVLTGINIGAYSHGGTGLPDLVRRLADTPGLSRLRLGSVEPPSVTEELVRAMVLGRPIVTPHLHMPIQSGSDEVLAAMGRRYNCADITRKVKLLRKNFVDPAITTDVIVNFPGEEGSDFEQTIRFVEDIGFSRLHVFPFSRRPGTPAAKLKDNDDSWPGERTERMEDMLALAKRLEMDFAAGCVNLSERVIIETDGNSGMSDRYVRVRFAEGKWRRGDVVAARITGMEKKKDGATLIAKLYSDCVDQSDDDEDEPDDWIDLDVPTTTSGNEYLPKRVPGVGVRGSGDRNRRGRQHEPPD